MNFDIINEINNDAFQSIDSKPQEAEKEINNADKVFQTDDVEKRLDDLRNSMTASSESKRSEGLSSKKSAIDTTFVEVEKPKTSTTSSTSSSSSNDWTPWGKSKTTTTVKEKTLEEKVREASNRACVKAAKEAAQEIEDERKSTKEVSSTWNIFDMHEKMVTNGKDIVEEQKKDKSKESKTKGSFRVAVLQTLAVVGKSLYEGVATKNEREEKKEKKTLF